MRRINFLRKFIPNYVEIVKSITDMLRKENEVKWHTTFRDSFTRIKEALVESLVLISREYSIPLYIYFLSHLCIPLLQSYYRKTRKVTSSLSPLSAKS